MKNAKMIDKNMSVEDIVKKYPETLSVFKNYGLECAGCKAALFKNLEEGAAIFKIELDGLLYALNKVVNRMHGNK